MNHHLHKLLALCLLLPLLGIAQNNNGQLDMLEEFSSMKTVGVPMPNPLAGKGTQMPDTVKLMTDIYEPITGDSMRVVLDLGSIDVPILGSINLGAQNLELIPKGVQLFIYDTLNGQPNPNPYQLPMLFTRTPYGKNGDIVGRIVSIMGYSYALQDMRGRYESQGVYMPMYSDSWNKTAYHGIGNNQFYKHVLDLENLNSPLNGNYHEDGYNSVQYLANSLKKWYDLDGDGFKETYDLFNNGTIGMFGASALGNTQLQAAVAHKIDPNARGLKCLFPIVATNEHYRYTGYQNGVFRERIVTGWLRGQIVDTDDSQNATDNSRLNSIHSSTDYGVPNKFIASNKAIDHFCENRYGSSTAGYYPNSQGRADMDASFAPVDANGESVDAQQNPLPASELTHSRYENADVPTYHLSGWWDIFVDGQLETWRNTRKILHSPVKNEKLQKIVIGPWAHQTTGGSETGDRKYPKNVGDIIGFAIDDIDINSLDVNKVLQSEIIAWFRDNMNRKAHGAVTGDPKVKIPESQRWQPVTVLGLQNVEVRVPSEDFIFPYVDLLNFLAGNAGLKNLSLEVRASVFGQQVGPQKITIDVPSLGSPILPELGGTVGTVTGSPGSLDFEKVPNVRFYVVGNDSAADANAGIGNGKYGNYWFSSDSFPITYNINWQNMYLHSNGKINSTAPTVTESPKIYVDDPNDPVKTVGGANMIVTTPDGSRISQGQMQMNSAENINYCINRAGVIQFETDAISDSLSVIGYPKFVLYGRTNPDGLTAGLTNTDFFVRVADEFPDGKIYFVYEGCVGARALEYAKHIYETGKEDANIPFANINIGEIYEYKFEMMPIAYTWGKGHKMKIFISSSNHPRYQSTPHLPLQDGEYFRRQPGDGQGYTFNGQFMMPRTAVQRVYFEPNRATHIELPVYKGYATANETPVNISNELHIVAYPNPAKNTIFLAADKADNYTVKVTNLLGQEMLSSTFAEDISLDISALPSGIYLFNIQDAKGEKQVTKKVTIE